ncbi:MAG: flagellar assembly protein FliH [Burkholderiales bacterium]
MTSSSDRPDRPDERRPSFAERVAVEGERRRPGHVEPSPFVRRAEDQAGFSGGAASLGDAAARGANPHTRFIPREEIGHVGAWQPTAFGGPRRDVPLTAAADRVTQQRQAEQEVQRQTALAAQRAEAEIAARAAELRGAREGGYHDGYRDGLAALEAFKHNHATQVTAQVAAVVQNFEAQLAVLEQYLAQRVAGIALEVARQVVRSEIKAHPEQVVAVTQEALGALLVSARHVTVRLHPDDHALVAHGLAEVLKARGARLVMDAQVARGGCRVDSDIASVDAGIATRWERASAALGRPGSYAVDASALPVIDGHHEPAFSEQGAPLAPKGAA